MKYFTLEELTASATARRLNIPNTPDACAIINLHALVHNVLDPAREAFGAPITITSGYRSTALNAAVHGQQASQHLTGHAADITCAPEKLRYLYLLISDTLIFDQLIYYRRQQFLHISYVSHRKNREQTIIKL